MRRLAALALLVFLTVSAGCTSLFGPGELSDDQLNEQATYDWDRRATVTIDIHTNNYTAVYRVENRTLEVYGNDALGLERPLDVQGVRFRYANGTVVAPADTPGFNITQGRERLTITTPAENGSVAFTVPKTGKTVTVPVFIEDASHEVIIPPETDVAVPLLGKVRPAPTSTEDVDGRIHIYWESVSAGAISVRYYLDRDLLIFGSLVGVMTIAGIAGAAYYLRQIRELERRREEVGLDVDTGDDRP
ncbi:DUF5803 family protein [Halomarina litorea]|uniref:DUF5803 family protein n=1 Tax=Halomarina litorea TaxID=2961595 RepID=UPI0020C53BE4|nr:DUF5803 family protein [Halomarina sp. BCD28]